MRTLDLNIQLNNPVKGEDGKEMTPVSVAIIWITRMIERAINKPDAHNRPTAQANMDTQRRCFKILDILDGHKDGIVTLEDDDFDFLYKKYHQAEIPFQKDIAEVLTKVERALDATKNEQKEK